MSSSSDSSFHSAVSSVFHSESQNNNINNNNDNYDDVIDGPHGYAVDFDRTIFIPSDSFSASSGTVSSESDSGDESLQYSKVQFRARRHVIDSTEDDYGNESDDDSVLSSPLVKRSLNTSRRRAIVLQDSDDDESSGKVGNNEVICLSSSDGSEESTVLKEEDAENLPVAVSLNIRKQVRDKKLTRKDQTTMAQRLFQEFNDTVFDEKLPRVVIQWSATLNKTAGKASASRTWNEQSQRSETTYGIDLSTKVLDSEEKLRNTLAHELCHVAVYAFHGMNKSIAPHGPEFKHYADKFHSAYGRDRVDNSSLVIRVTTTHSYEIDYRYRYTCSGDSCGKVYGRHSKSIDMSRKVCGRCKSKLLLFTRTGILITDTGEAIRQDGTPVKLNPFATFVKDNFARVKGDLVHSSPQPVKHKDVMALLGEQWKQLKI